MSKNAMSSMRRSPRSDHARRDEANQPGRGGYPKLAGTNKRLGFKATGVINRLDYGMSFGYPIISDLIHLTVTTEASAGP